MYSHRTAKPLSYLQRQAAAQARDDARREAWEDPETQAVRRIRAEMVALSDIDAEAMRQHERDNSPVPAPRGAGGALLHPQRVQRIAELIAAEGWSDDPAEPISATISLAERRETMAAETRARMKAAEEAYEALLAEKRGEPAPALDPSPIAETAEAGPPRRGRPPRLPSSLFADE